MKADGRDLIEAYRRGSAPSDRSGCIAPELLAEAALAGRLPEEALRHVSECSSCADELRALDPMAEWARNETRASSRRRLLDARWALPLAASLLLAAGALLLPERPRPSDPPRDRGVSTAVSAVRPRDEARLARPPSLFSWPASPQAASYRVVVSDARGTPLWESAPLSAPEAAVPEDVRARLASPGIYYWKYVERTATDERSSEAFQFRIER